MHRHHLGTIQVHQQTQRLMCKTRRRRGPTHEDRHTHEHTSPLPTQAEAPPRLLTPLAGALPPRSGPLPATCTWREPLAQREWRIPALGPHKRRWAQEGHTALKRDGGGGAHAEDGKARAAGSRVVAKVRGVQGARARALQRAAASCSKGSCACASRTRPPPLSQSSCRRVT